ncbi:MAG: LytTR family DNA-binding domain-containing protein [Opitutaceae bacterium]|nr:LytTR family DNA-binding domain-containing protein [Opitutaceae bacterium]
MNYRVLIVDDEPLARAKARSLFSHAVDFRIVGEASNGHDAIRLVRELKPDVLLLDIEMPPSGGFEVIRMLGEEVPHCVIFATAHPQHAIEAFEVDVLDYLLKPYSEERFKYALERVRRRLPEQEAAKVEDVGVLERMLVKSGGRHFVVRTSDIVWGQAAANYVVIHSTSGNHVIRSTLNQMMDRLAEADFFRVSRSAFVRLDCIKEVHQKSTGNHVLLLTDGQKVVLQRNLRELQQRLARRTVLPAKQIAV